MKRKGPLFANSRRGWSWRSSRGWEGNEGMMNFEGDEEWDLELIDNLVRKEEEAIAAKKRRRAAAPPPAQSQPSILQPRGPNNITLASSIPAHNRHSQPLIVKNAQQAAPINRVSAPFASSLVRQDIHSLPVTRSHNHADASGRSLHSQVAAYHAGGSMQGEWKSTVLVPNKEKTIKEPHQVNEVLCSSCKRASYVSLSSEQRDIQRLSAQLLFKDQELLEARRIQAEKAEQLKVAVEELEIVKKHYDNFIQLRQSEPLKVGKGDNLTSNYSLLKADDTVAVCIPTETKIDGNMLRLEDGSYMNKNQYNTDLWLPPWTTEGPPVSDDKRIIQRPFAISSQGKLPNDHHSNSLAVAELKLRTNEIGCTSLAHQENGSSMGVIQAQELSCRMPSLLAKTAKDLGDKATSQETLAQERLEGQGCLDSQKLSRKLFRLWSTEDKKEGVSGLISKLFAACRAELCVLFSSGSKYLEGLQEPSSWLNLYAILDIEKQVVKETISDDPRDNEVEREFLLVAELYCILAKVANGLASSWDLFTLLMKYCKSQNMHVVQSSLRVLRFILFHDTNCRQMLFERTFLQPNEKVMENRVDLEVGKDTREVAGKREYAPLMSCMIENKRSDIPRLHSPRIIRKVEGANAQEHPKQINNIGKDNSINVQDEASRSGLCEGIPQGLKCDRVLYFLNWILNFALNGTTLAVKFEATALLTLLVMHTEPMVEREIFSSLVAEGSIASLLNRSSGLDAQMQAVRLLHFLLYCPSVLEMLCTAEDEQQNVSGNEKVNNHYGVGNKEGRIAYEGSHSDVAENKALHGEAKCSMDKVNRKACQRKVLESLSSCLFCTVHNLQEYALRRCALRVLTYMTTSGNAGAAAIMSIRVTTHEEYLRKDAGAGLDVERCTEKSNSSMLSIPVCLLSLLNAELIRMEEETTSSMTPIAEERGCLIQEALTLLCRLACHSTQSVVVMAALTTHKATVRLSISVLNRLIYKCLSPSSIPFQDVIELAKGLRRKLLAGLSDS